MRVLILSQYFWPENFRINEVADSLAAQDCEVTVLTGHPTYPLGNRYPGTRWWRFQRESQVDGYEILRVPLVPRSARGGALNFVANYLSFVLFATVGGLWWGRRRKWDVIFVYAISPILQSIPGMVLRRCYGPALVTWVQDLWPDSLRATGFVRSPRMLSRVEQLVRWIYRHNDLLLAQSRSFLPRIASLASGVEIRYHPNPGERGLEEQVRTEDSPALTFAPGFFNIVFAGNHGKLQGLDTLLRAAELTRGLPDIRWIFIGDGSEKASFRDRVSAAGLDNVVLYDSVPLAAMPGIFAQAHALVLALVDDSVISSTIPSKVQAYLAAGRPILAAMNGEGAAVITAAGAGKVCRADDAEELARNAQAVAAMPDEARAAYGAAGRAYYAEHFASSRLTTALIEHFRWAVERRRSQ